MELCSIQNMADVHSGNELLKQNVKIEASKSSNPDLQTGNVNDSGAMFINDPDHKSEFALKGTIIVADKEKQLELTTTGLALTDQSVVKKKNNKDLILAWRNVICAAPDPNGTDEQQHKSFILHYVHHGSKNLLRHHSVKIEVKNEYSETWINAIHTECGKAPEWITYKSNGRLFNGILAIPCEIYGAGCHVELLINTGCSIAALLKETYKIFKRKPTTSSSAHLDCISGVSAFWIKLIGDNSEPGGALSRTEARARELEHILNIDGEVVYIDKLEMDVRTVILPQDSTFICACVWNPKLPRSHSH